MIPVVLGTDRPPRDSRTGFVKWQCKRSEAISTPGQRQDETRDCFPAERGISLLAMTERASA